MSPGWFQRRSKSATKAVRKQLDSLPDGLWTKCPKCGEILFSKQLEKDLKVCNKCGYHYKLRAFERLAITVDEGSFVEMDADLSSENPLGFPEYEAKIEKGAAASELKDGMVTGTATLNGRPLVIGVADFAFMGGSMGSVYGEKVARAFERAVADSAPIVMINSSGGARMQEGLLSLMQMAKTSAAASRLHDAGLMYVSVLTDPTTAGVLASFAMQADVVVAEPDAMVAFAGRVATHSQGVKLPPNYQRSEFQFEHGMIDVIVPRKDMKDTLAKLLAFGVQGGTHAAERA